MNQSTSPNVSQGTARIRSGSAQLWAALKQILSGVAEINVAAAIHLFATARRMAKSARDFCTTVAKQCWSITTDGLAALKRWAASSARGALSLFRNKYAWLLAAIAAAASFAIAKAAPYLARPELLIEFSQRHPLASKSLIAITLLAEVGFLLFAAAHYIPRWWRALGASAKTMWLVLPGRLRRLTRHILLWSLLAFYASGALYMAGTMFLTIPPANRLNVSLGLAGALAIAVLFWLNRVRIARTTARVISVVAHSLRVALHSVQWLLRALWARICRVASFCAQRIAIARQTKMVFSFSRANSTKQTAINFPLFDFSIVSIGLITLAGVSFAFFSFANVDTSVVQIQIAQPSKPAAAKEISLFQKAKNSVQFFVQDVSISAARLFLGDKRVFVLPTTLDLRPEALYWAHRSATAVRPFDSSAIASTDRVGFSDLCRLRAVVVFGPASADGAPSANEQIARARLAAASDLITQQASKCAQAAPVLISVFLGAAHTRSSNTDDQLALVAAGLKWFDTTRLSETQKVAALRTRLMDRSSPFAPYLDQFKVFDACSTSPNSGFPLCETLTAQTADT